MFINSVLKGSPCLTNVADAAFTAYFVHNISAVDGWDLSFSLPKNRPMVLGELKKTRMSARCRIRLMASPVLGS